MIIADLRAIAIFFASLLVLGGWLLLRSDPQTGKEVIEKELIEIIAKPDYVTERPLDIAIIENVPFTSQAPLGDWKNVVFQQGCEEASVLMAMLWVEGKKFISPKDAEKAIVSISNFEQENYGEFRDTSAQDTAKVMRDYFGYKKGEVKYDIGSEDIKRELGKGNLVIAPVNGQKMGNPFYTPPGPIQHMVVIYGYDAKTKEFVTNDPGTKRGEGFRYRDDVLEGALQDYGTGYKEQIWGIRKAMIVIEP